ncbi:MAG: 50S ribosomal protein L32 [Candidatus Falkowbacteria bacterium]|nr:50S ribosomal protein L32 [Candidatus Falkowbacteria bacterium]
MVQMKKRTKSSTNRRRAHLALKPKTVNKCPKCGKTIMPHRACAFCGNYRFMETVKPKAIKKKK